LLNKEDEAWICPGEEEEEEMESTDVPGGVWIFIATSIGTMVASILGCSPIIVHVESLAGIDEGGKTGLCSLVISSLFTLALFFAPALGKIPPCATSPVLIILGCLMMQEAVNLDWGDMQEAVPSFFTIVIMPFTFSIPNGIVFGLVSYLGIYVITAILGIIVRRCYPDSIPLSIDNKEKVLPFPGKILVNKSPSKQRRESGEKGRGAGSPSRYWTNTPPLSASPGTPRYGISLPGSPNAQLERRNQQQQGKQKENLTTKRSHHQQQQQKEGNHKYDGYESASSLP